MTGEIISCKNCGTNFSGNYCNHCGEQVHKEEHKKLHYVFDETFHFLTHLDNKFLRSIRLVLFKPGYLSLQYCNGIRKKYFKPIGLFIICVVIYLFFPAFKGLNMVFGTYVSKEHQYHYMAAPIVNKKMDKKNISLIELGDLYDSKSPKISKFLLLLYLPISALILFMLFSRNRKYFYDHFILSTELNTFFVAAGFLILPFILLLITWIAKMSNPDFEFTERMVGVLLLSLFSFCVINSIRRFYKQKWLWTISKSLVFLALYVLIIIPVYNYILFLTVMLFI
jgi:hypothetical protein